MHALESIKLVTMLSQPTVELVSSDELTPRFTNSFWGASKCREQRWKLELSKLAPRLKAAQKPDESWAQYAQLVEEIFIAEIQTRVWLAKVSSAAQGQEDLEMIADLIVAEHSQIRSQALNMLASLNNFDRATIEFKEYIRKLQANAMQGTDMILGHMDCNEHAIKFAFDKTLCKTIAEQASGYPAQAMVKIRKKIGESVYASLEPATIGVAFAPDLNSQIMDCISGCIVPELANA